MSSTRSTWSNALACLAVAWRCAKGPLSAQYALSLLGGVLPVTAAVASQKLFDGIGTDVGTATIAWLAVVVAVSASLMALVSLPITYLATVVDGRVTLDVEDVLFRGVCRSTGIGPFEDPDYLTRLRLAEQAAQEAPQTVAGFGLTLVQGGVSAVGLFIAVIAVWPPMAVLVGIGIAANVIAQSTLVRVEVTAARTVSETFRRRYLYQSLLTDARSVKEVRLLGLADFFRTRMLTAIKGSTDAQLLVQRRTTQLGMLLTLLSGLVAGIGLVIVAIRAGHGSATVGDITLFLAAATGIQTSVQSMVREWGQARSSAILFDHFRSMISEDADLPDGHGAPPPLRHGIEFRDVWFRYAADGEWVLRGLDLVIPAGGSLAIVGLNGAGKSSTIKLLCRLYDPERGTILWDGVDIRLFSAAELRRRIAVTFQDFMPYDLTARENIGIGQLDRMDDDHLIRRAARRAGADGLVSRLPRGYDTMLSRSFDDAEEEAGVTLSGGQWQRVALARSFAREDADLLVLDEPSSGLDAQSEAEIHRTLRVHRDRCTSIIISHRLSTIRDVDTIVVLRHGRVLESGSHAELISSDGEYARLFGLQSQGYRDPITAVATP